MHQVCWIDPSTGDWNQIQTCKFGPKVEDDQHRDYYGNVITKKRRDFYGHVHRDQESTHEILKGEMGFFESIRYIESIPYIESPSLKEYGTGVRKEIREEIQKARKKAMEQIFIDPKYHDSTLMPDTVKFRRWLPFTTHPTIGPISTKFITTNSTGYPPVNGYEPATFNAPGVEHDSLIESTMNTLGRNLTEAEMTNLTQPAINKMMPVTSSRSPEEIESLGEKVLSKMLKIANDAAIGKAPS